MIVVFDLETTGVFHSRDRIVQIGAVKIDENFVEKDRFLQLINPGRPIPQRAIDVHHITDEDVKGCPTLEEVIDDVLEFFDDCDLGGYNVLSFDLPMLITETKRCGREFDVEGRRVFDAYAIFRQYEKRDLASAYRMYCQDEIGESAHDAMVDTLATVSIIESQLSYYGDRLTNLDDHSRVSRGNRVTIDGKVVWNEDNEACFSFGKHKGRTLEWAYKYEKQYLKWLRNGGEFSEEAQGVWRAAIAGRFPKKDAGSGCG